MENSVEKPCGQFNYIMQHKNPTTLEYNTKVALWRIPYNSKYKEFDEDGTKWFESKNKYGNDEIAQAENSLNMDFSEYKVRTTTIWYDDATYDIESQYRNNTVTENHGSNHVYIKIKNRSNQIVAEKIFGFDSADGRKTIYKHYINGDDTFSIVHIYSYNTTKNRATDIVNYGYTSDESALTKGCTFEKEYYLLNGKQVEAQKTESGGYIVRNKDGKILTFQVE